MARTAWLTASMLLALAATARAQAIGFDEQKADEAPKGFACERTGKGRDGVWRVARDGTAPSAPNVLVQTDADPTAYRFPHCVLDGVRAKDGDRSVLSGLDLRVGAGDALALLGPSGSGKTSILRVGADVVTTPTGLAGSASRRRWLCREALDTLEP